MKMKKLGISLLVGIMTMALTACGGSDSASTGEGVQTITFGHVSAEATSTHQAALRFKELIEANSDGQLRVDVYPSSQLGGDRELIESTQTGAVTAMLSSPAPQVNFVQSATIFDAPFVFDDIHHGRAVVSDSEFEDAIAKEYATAGLQYLGTASQGFRTLTSNRRVDTLEDLRGLSIRTMENQYHMAAWRQLGANPTPLTFAELYTALQQGTVNAQENPVELIHSQKFYEVQNYIYNTNHILQTNVWIMNKGFYEGLSDELKAVVNEAAAEAIAYANQYNDDHEPQYIQDMKDYGAEFVELPSSEIARFVEAVTPVYEMIQGDTKQEVFDAYFNAIERHRNN